MNGGAERTMIGLCAIVASDGISKVDRGQLLKDIRSSIKEGCDMIYICSNCSRTSKEDTQQLLY